MKAIQKATLKFLKFAKLFTCLAAAIFVVALIAGCSQATTSADNTSYSADNGADSIKQDYDLVLVANENPTDELLITNDTGKDIAAFALRVFSDVEYGTNLLTAASVWKDGDVAQLRYSKALGSSVAENAASAAASQTESKTESQAKSQIESQKSPLADATIKALVDVKLTFVDDTVAYLHNVSFADLEEPSLQLDDGLAYLKYIEDGKAVETLETEKALKAAEVAAEDAKIKADAEIKAAEEARIAEETRIAEEAAAASAAAAVVQQSTGYTYDYGGVAGGTAGNSAVASSDAAGAPANQSSDSCLGDSVLKQ